MRLAARSALTVSHSANPPGKSVIRRSCRIQVRVVSPRSKARSWLTTAHALRGFRVVVENTRPDIETSAVLARLAAQWAALGGAAARGGGLRVALAGARVVVGDHPDLHDLRFDLSEAGYEP